ncbi:MAG TPA: histidine kinase [Puia sp.]|nr:histidine kinase [Puia sp.]
MKIRWRQHEMIFVSINAAILLAGYLWSMHNVSPGQYAAPFINNNIPFNFYKNVVLPQIGGGLAIYLSYLFVNIFTIPRMLFPKKFEAGTSKLSVSLTRLKVKFQGMAKKIFKNSLWVIIQIVLLIFVAGSLLNIAIYYLHQWEYDYPGLPGFLKKNIAQSTMDLFWGYEIIASLIAIYGLYVCIREIIINFVGRPGNRRDYRAMICNQITTFLIIYLSVPILLESFHLIHESPFYTVYFSIVLPVFLMAISNMYWIFPIKGNESFLKPAIVFRLLLSASIFSIPIMFFIHEGFAPALVLYISVLLFIITPITWLVYQKRKDELQLLRGAEKTIAKSKTDLQFLRSQINPHFLFNVLNTLYGTALQENAERTSSGIQKLGDMMRFMLHENNLDFIQMSKEIDYLKNYIALQKLRTELSSDIIIEDNISGQNCNHKIAPMLLIPFVENAFKHGISLKEKSWIKINLECNEKNILFEVRNSMHAKNDNDPEKERSGIGFKNVLERLKLIYGGRFQASVNADGQEFFVQLAIQP